jgi:hypothetical protein
VGKTLELARFRVREADERTLVRVRDHAMRALAAECPGHLSGQLARLDDDIWLDVIVWESREAALAAAKRAPAIPACREYFDLFSETVSLEHADLIVDESTRPTS